MHRAWFLLVVIVLSSSLMGCVAVPDPATVNGARTQPALPAPASLLEAGKLASASLGYVEGNQFATALPNNKVVAGSWPKFSARFWPSVSGSTLADYAYAIYRVPVDQSGALSWAPQWTPGEAPASGACYVGFGNRVSNRWDWYPGDASAQLPNGADYVAADNTVLIAIIVLPAAAWSILDHFSLEAAGPGWSYAVVDSLDAPNFDDDIWSVDATTVGGKPALLYYSGPSYDYAASSLKLAVSATATGAVAGEWTSYDLGSNKTFAVLADIGGGFGIAYRSLQAPSELHYMYSVDPALGFSDELAAHDGHVLHLADVGGKPALSYLYEPIVGSVQIPYYAAADAVSGGTWHATKLSDLSVSDSVVEPLARPADLGGKPVVAFVSQTTPGHLYIAATAQALPTADMDWTLLDLGATYEHECFLDIINGKLNACTGEWTLGVSDAHFKLYTLQGADPLSAADWTSLDLISLGLGALGRPQLLALGTETALAYTQYVAEGPLGGQTRLSVLHSAAPADSAAAWSTLLA